MSLQECWEQAARSPDCDAYVSTEDDWDASGRDSAQRVAAIAPTDVNILEYGCGSGRVTRHLAGLFPRVVAVDFSPTMCDRVLALALSNVEVVCGDARTLARCEGDYAPIGAITSDSVLLHNRKRDVREILYGLRRIVPSGALFALQLPVYETGACEPQHWLDVGVWTRHELECSARVTGWEPRVIHVNPGSFAYEAPGSLHGALHVLEAT